MWVAVLGDARKRPVLEAALAGAAPTLTRFTQLELLTACRDEMEWGLLERYLAAQDYAELDAETWVRAARLQFELAQRRRPTTRGAPAERRGARRAAAPEGPDLIDCCVAQVAIDHAALLLHADPRFEAVAQVRALRHRRLRL